MSTEQKTIEALIRGGFNPDDAANMVEKHFDEVVKIMGLKTPKHIARYITYAI